MGARALTGNTTEPAGSHGRRRLWPLFLGFLGLLWFLYSPASTSKKQQVAFVVLTDPRERHEENVIPMLAHVEQKYGALQRSRAESCRRNSSSIATGWTGHPYYIFIDQELPSEAVQNATRDATNGKASWHLIDESVGWGKPDWWVA